MNNSDINNSNSILRSNIENESLISNQEIFTYQVLADTVDHAIIKYTINGAIPRDFPILILDTKSLICADISTAYDQIGQTIPRLPNINDVNASKELYTLNNNYCNKQFDIQQGKTSLNYNYPNGIPNTKNDILPSPSFCIPDIDEIKSINNIRSQEINDITSSYQNYTFIDIYNPENNIPFNFTNNDLVTFNPSGSGRFFTPTDVSFYGNSDTEITPILIGLADNSETDRTKYVLLENKNLNETIKILNKIELTIALGCNSGITSRNFLEKQNFLFFPLDQISRYFSFCNNQFKTQGLWKYDGGCSYRYYIEKVCLPYTITAIPINPNEKAASINFIIKTIENTKLGDFKFKLQTNDNSNYNVLVYSSTNYKKKILSNKRYNFLKIINQYDLFGKEHPIGYWSLLCSCVYRYNLTTVNFFIFSDLLSFKKLFRENGFSFDDEEESTMIYKDYDNTPLSKYINLIRLIFYKKKDGIYSIQIVCSIPISKIIEKILSNYQLKYRTVREPNNTNLTISVFKINDFEYVYYSNYRYIIDAIGLIFEMVPKQKFITSESMSFDKGGIYLNRDIITDNILFNGLNKNNWIINFDYNGCFYIYKKIGNKPNKDIIQDVIVIQFQNNYTGTVGILNQYLLSGNLLTIEQLLKELTHNNIPIFFNKNKVLLWSRYYQPSGQISLILQIPQSGFNLRFSITGKNSFLNAITTQNPEVFFPPKYECFAIKILFISLPELSALLNLGWVRYSYYLDSQLIKLENGVVSATISVINNSNDINNTVDPSQNLTSNDGNTLIYGTIESINILIKDFEALGVRELIIKNIVPTTQVLNLFQLNETNIEDVDCLYSQGIPEINTNVYQIFAEDRTIRQIAEQLIKTYPEDKLLVKPFNLNALNINVSLNVFGNLLNILSITDGRNNYEFRIDNTCNNKLCCLTTSNIRLYVFSEDSNRNVRNPNSFVGAPISSTRGVNLTLAATNSNNIFSSLSNNESSNPPINYYTKYINSSIFDFGLLSKKLKGQPIRVSGLNLTQLEAYNEGLDPPGLKPNLRPTDLFFQIVNLGNKLQIIADEQLLDFWKKILEFVNITYVEAGTFEFTNLIASACGCESIPIKQGINNYINPIMGKVVGLSSAPSRQTAPVGNLNPIVSIQTLTWALAPDETKAPSGQTNNALGGSIQLYWETNQFNQCPLSARDLNYLAFQIPNGTQSNYGRTDALGGGFLLTDNSGQPPIGNDAFNPTGNVLMTTNGNRVEGTIIIKYTKTLNWWNNFSGFIFPGPTDTLQAAIQDQELINRVWRQFIFQQNQERTLIPYLFRLERNNRFPNRISDANPSYIYHYIVGTINFRIPVFLLDTVDNNEIITHLTDILSINKYVNTNTLNLDIINKNQNKENIVISYKIKFPPIQKNIYTPQNHSYADVVKTEKEILKLNDDYTYIFYGHNSIFRYISKFKITTEIEVYLLNAPQSGPRIGPNPKNIFDAEIRLLSIIKNMELREHLTNARMDIRSDPQSVGAVHYPNGVNTNNITKWLDTTVKTLLHGSEFPIRLIPPNRDKPFYRFMDGTPVKNFIVNAWGTGYTIPSVALPSPVISNKPNNDIHFGNLTQRNTKNKVIGGNTNVLY